MATLRAHKYGCTLVNTYRPVQQSHAGVIHLIRCSFSITAVCASVFSVSMRVYGAFKFACKPMCAFNFMLIHVCSTVCFNARLLYNMVSVPNVCKHRDVTCIYLYVSADKYTLSQVVCVYAYAVTPLLLSYQSAVNLRFNFQWIIYPCRSPGTCTGHGSENI